ncbi:MAG: ATP-grasp domain-containing protein [Gemmatimonadales bacterium]|jgi:predicted ATP-grasp superfamily ATP-dependent carboligase
MRRIVITDAEQRAALAVVRSLGNAGWEIAAIGSKARPIAAASRHVCRFVRTSDPVSARTEFVAQVVEFCGAFRPSVVIPVADASLLALLPARQLLDPAVIPFPPEDVVLAAGDKAHVLEVARGLGIATPQQLVLQGPEALADAAPRFPVAVKPTRSFPAKSGPPSARRTAYANDAAELRRLVESYSSNAFPLLVQERVEGPGLGIFLLRWRGVTRAVFAHRRIREKPPSGGVSTCCESVPAESSLVSQSTALLDALRWDGVAMVEYKLDRRCNVPVLMEVNGRFWGSLQLAIDAGIDFPSLLVDAALDRPAEILPPYRVGVRSRWWWGDVDHVLARLRRRRGELVLPQDAPSVGRVLIDVFLPRRGQRNDVLRRDDPRPFFAETLNWIRRA